MFNLKSAADVRHLQINKSHYRDNWLVGFGWNHKNWVGAEFPDLKTLDEVFPDTPVFFSRVDGHTSWINSRAITEFKKMGFNFDTEPTGILTEQAHINALLNLPDFNLEQHKLFFNRSQKIFNQAGFTHVRDMSMNLNSWQMLSDMENKKNLTVCVESFVTAENFNDSDRALNEIKVIRGLPSKQLRILGVKIFIDGSLGSKTAYLSQNYLNTETCGQLNWTFNEIKELIKKAWLVKEEVAIHCIGDEAVHTAVLAAREVAAGGLLGRLHLEHVQVLRPETLLAMKPLHITCHMQPCHWLSDHSWLKQSLPESLVKNLFQWELLRKNKIPFYFGSDSPIEPPSLFNTKKALEQSVGWGVPKLNADWKLYHSHPDAEWVPSHTEITDNEVKQVYFNNEPLL